MNRTLSALALLSLAAALPPRPAAALGQDPIVGSFHVAGAYHLGGVKNGVPIDTNQSMNWDMVFNGANESTFAEYAGVWQKNAKQLTYRVDCSHSLKLNMLIDYPGAKIKAKMAATGIQVAGDQIAGMRVAKYSLKLPGLKAKAKAVGAYAGVRL